MMIGRRRKIRIIDTPFQLTRTVRPRERSQQQVDRRRRRPPVASANRVEDGGPDNRDTDGGKIRGHHPSPPFLPSSPPSFSLLIRAHWSGRIMSMILRSEHVCRREAAPRNQSGQRGDHPIYRVRQRGGSSLFVTQSTRI